MSALPTLITRATNGSKANGDSYASAGSANGRYALFISDATNLHADLNGTRDVFRADLLTGSVMAVNILPDGSVEADASFRKSSVFLGADGNRVVFSTGGALYVRDIAAGVTTLLAASVVQDDYPLIWAPGQWNYPHFGTSASGRYVAFSSASALVASDTNGLADVFVLDLSNASITRASTSGVNGQGNGKSLRPIFSQNETWVQFNSYATNLSPGDTSKSDVFLKNLQTGELRIISRLGANAGAGTASNGHSFGQGFTSNGRFALFESEASNIVAGDTNGVSDVFAYDIHTDRVSLVSIGAMGQANGGSGFASAVPGTDIVSFVSSANNLVPRDTNGARDVFFKQLSTGKIVTFSAFGMVQPNDETLSVVFSPDGSQAFVSTKASNIVAEDSDRMVDIVALPTTQIIAFLTTAGTEGVDTLTGSVGPDVLRSLGGNDTLHGGNGDDLLQAGAGADLLYGDAGDDALFGDDGNDILFDGPGNDTLNGGAGWDIVVFDAGFRGASVTLEDNGNYTVLAGINRDTVRGVEEMRFLDGRIVFDAADPAAQVTRLYRAALGRDPDQGGLNNWIGVLQRGGPLEGLAAAFVGSTEFAAQFGALDGTAFVTQLYRNILDRVPDPGGLQFWTAQLRNLVPRASVLTKISESEENRARTTATLATGIWDRDEDSMGIGRLYQAVLGRTPDAAGLAFWRGTLTDGSTLGAMADSFAGSAEFQATYGTLTNREFVQALYANTLGREGDGVGVDFWTTVLVTGAASRSNVVLGFSESAEHQARTAPAIGGEARDQLGIRLL